ncbi:uncharacterized protein ACLA_043590 [Aspergillus clavatus NRRL 1]|uniref:Protein HRI1 n=1 Tax=Aspergillus clavatus (strain ATCC 1007 / CBS 513.65 / DSM 816 / NCTC 3887 / NRRL 1 / QM 1276 / 107) TaxID=344612 RepID=A1C8K2_ASPCL|nr:uncharacterized protein ACLA_043590 [Aspergillus clavatus NRRL 1]EAW13639.1 conserved hypothetical protein [Aspergillus clavatus NRRL 1]
MTSNTHPTPQGSLSTRISLRWLPGPAFENTDTFVMSLTGWYVDLRVDKASGRLDWAIAGRRIVESTDPLRVRFTHEIDSRGSFADADCGTFTALDDGDELEVGKMARVDLPGCPVRAYEEVWRELPFRRGPEGEGRGVSWVLEGWEAKGEGEEGVGIRTFVARLWGSYLVLRQRQTRARSRDGRVVVTEGGEVSARREEWGLAGGWEVKYALGPEVDGLPSMRRTLADDRQWSMGEKVVIADQTYIVRAYEKIG